MLRLSLRHLRRHWQLNLVMLCGVLMGAALAAALPMYTLAVAELALQDALRDSTIAQRNLTLSGDVRLTTVRGLDADLADLMRDRRQFSLQRVRTENAIFRADGTAEQTFFSDFLLDLWSVDPLDSEAVLIEGRWPDVVLRPTQSTGLDNPVIEVAIGSAVSEEIDLGIGDKLRVPLIGADLEIVGLVEPRDPSSDIWFGDVTLLRFKATRFVDGTTNTDEMRIGVLLPARTIASFVTDESEWRYLINLDAINASNSAEIYARLLSIETQYSRLTEWIETGLITQLERIETERTQAQTGLFLLLIQSILAIFYTLALFTQFAVEQAQLTFGTLMGRGFNRSQLTRLLALGQAITFFGVALPLAPLLALQGVRLWARNEPSVQITTIPLASWGLAAGIVVTCWIMVVLSAYLSTGRNLLGWLRQRTRPVDPEQRTRQLVLELFILAAGGLAYWQLRNSAELLGTGTSNTLFGAGDPILLLAPTLVLLGIGLLALRLMPLLIGFIASFSASARSFLVPISLLRLARDTTTSARVVLLITFTVALALFATIMNSSLTQRQLELAHYATGADLRLHLSFDKESAETEIAHISANPAVRSVSHVVRGRGGLTDDSGTASLHVGFLAVDPATLPNVSVYPPNLSPFTLRTVVSILESDKAGILPVVIGRTRNTNHLNRGDQFMFSIGRREINAEVVGIIETFPTLDQNFLVTSLPILETLTDIEDYALAARNERELWIDVVAGQQASAIAVANELPTDSFRPRVLGDAVAQTDAYQRGLIARETSAALQINMIVLLVLSAVGFLTIQYFAAQQRFAEFGVLNALGIGRNAWFRLISAEAVAMLIIGLVLGTILGTALSYMMRPLLVSLLTASIGSESSLNLSVSPRSIVTILGLLILVYGIAIAVLNQMLRRTDLQKQLRLTQE